MLVRSSSHGHDRHGTSSIWWRKKSHGGARPELASTPVDRAKTLLMTRGAEYGGNMVSCLVKIAQDDGLAGLYRGFLATWMRIGPWAFLFFVCFEQFRNALNGLQALLEKPKAK